MNDLFSPIIKDFLEPFSYLIYSVAFLLAQRNHRSVHQRLLCAYYFAGVLLIGYASILSQDLANNNNWLYNIFYFLSAIFIGYYFRSVLYKKSNKNAVVVLFSAAGLLYLYVIFVDRYRYFNSYTAAFLFLCIVIGCLLFFHEMLTTPKEDNILMNFDLWVVCGYFMYFLGGFFIILTYKYFTDTFTYDHRAFLGQLWSLLNALLLFTSILTLSGQLWIAHRKKFPS